MKLVGKAERPPGWHEERMLGIGGSEAAAAVGLSPWLDPLELWAIKRGEAAPQDSTFRMRLGNLIEPVIGRLYSDETGKKLRAHARQFVHSEYPFVRDHPDFSIVGERVLVQAKNAGPWAAEWGEPGPPEAIPVHYRLQGYHELAATGFDRVDFAVLSGDEFGIWPLERDEDLIDELIADEGRFWQCVIDGTMPDVSANSGPALLRRFPKPTGEVKIASAEQEATIREYVSLRELRAQAESREDLAQARVLAMIGDGLAIEGAGVRVTWGEVKGSPQWKAVATALWEAHRADGSPDLIGSSLVDDYRGDPYRKVSIAKLGRSEK